MKFIIYPTFYVCLDWHSGVVTVLYKIFKLQVHTMSSDSFESAFQMEEVNSVVRGLAVCQELNVSLCCDEPLMGLPASEYFSIPVCAITQ